MTPVVDWPMSELEQGLITVLSLVGTMAVCWAVMIYVPACLIEASMKRQRNRAGEALTVVMRSAAVVLEAMGEPEVEAHARQREQALMIVAESIVGEDVCASDWFEGLQRRVWLEAYHWRPGLADPRRLPAATPMPGPGREVLW